MKVGSLFSGVGLMDLGLQQAGHETLWHAEIEPYARAVMRERFPAALDVGDVHEVERRAGELPMVDLLAGGFPCQDISSAGRRAGIEGERSGLWRTFAAIIAATRPRWVLIENVARLRFAGLDVVLGDLAARGYDAEWDVVSAASLGAPHLRERIWIVAWDPVRVRLPDPFGDALRVEREREWEQRGVEGAPVAGDDGARLADASEQRRSEGLRHRGDKGSAGSGWAFAAGGGASVADASGERCAVEREGDDHNGHHAPGHEPHGRDAGFRIFDAASLAVARARAASETWPRSPRGAEPGLGGGSDGGPDRVDAPSMEPWERGLQRGLAPAEADARRAWGERRSMRLRGIGNGVAPPIVRWIGERIALADERWRVR